MLILLVILDMVVFSISSHCFAGIVKFHCISASAGHLFFLSWFHMCHVSFQPLPTGFDPDVRGRGLRHAAYLLQPPLEALAAAVRLWALGRGRANVQAVARCVVRVEGPSVQPTCHELRNRAFSHFAFVVWVCLLSHFSTHTCFRLFKIRM